MEPLRVQIGSATIKQYGRFHFKSHDAYRGNQEIPSFRYWVKLENEDGSVDDVGLILMKNSTFPLFLEYLLEWLRRQYILVYRACQQLEVYLENGEESNEVIQGQQQYIELIQTRYNHVVQALREIAFDSQVDESLPEPLPSEG